MSAELSPSEGGWVPFYSELPVHTKGLEGSSCSGKDTGR